MTYSLRYLAMLGENGEMDLGRLGERCKHWSSTVQNISTDHCECLEPSKRDSEPPEVQICQAEQNHKAGFNTSQQLLHPEQKAPYGHPSQLVPRPCGPCGALEPIRPAHNFGLNALTISRAICKQIGFGIFAQ
jgi:hypothetical protein